MTQAKVKVRNPLQGAGAAFRLVSAKVHAGASAPIRWWQASTALHKHRPVLRGQRGQPSVQHPRLGEVVLKNWRQRGQGRLGQPSVRHPRLGEVVLMATRPRQRRGQPSVQHRRLGEVVFGKKKKIDDSAVQGHASGEVGQVRPSSTKCQSKRFLTSWRCWAGVI